VADELIIPEAKLADPQLLGARRGLPVAGLLGLAVAFGVFGFANLLPASQGDRMSGADIARLGENFRKARGALLPVDTGTRESKAELMQALPMSRMQAERLMAMVERGERMLGWLTLWDNFDEDGDAVSVSAAGFTQSVALRHAPVRILVPYVPGQPVFITGERDGGGGVTVAVELSSGPLPLPPLAVGQTVALPLQ
jgi:hypothetical protein